MGAGPQNNNISQITGLESRKGEEKLISLKKKDLVPPFSPDHENALEREERIIQLFRGFMTQLTEGEENEIKLSGKKIGDGITSKHIYRYFERSSTKAPGIPIQSYAHELLKVADASRDGIIDYIEFRRFVLAQEAALWDLFKQIDVSQDLKLQPQELSSSLKRAVIGIEVNPEELEEIVTKMDTDGDGSIDFAEWRNFLLFLPRDLTIQNIYQYTQAMNLMTFDGEISVISSNQFNFKSKVYYLLAGGIAGAVSRTFTAPLDRLKVYLQTCANFPTQNTTTVVTKRSFVSAITRWITTVKYAVFQLYNEGGFFNFFRGNGLNIVKIIPESAMKFYAFETAKSYILHLKGGNKNEVLTSYDRLLAGGIAGLASQTLIYPLELIKTRRMSELSKPGSVLETGKNITAQYGLRGLFKGIAPTLIGVFPFAAIDLALFETLKLSYLKHKQLPPDTRPNPLVTLSCGMMSGTLGAVAVYPLSLIRTRLQAQGTPTHPQVYRNAFHAIQLTYEKEALKGFYKGLTPTLLKVVPSVSIFYVVYENTKTHLDLN
ncbi:mitochondrial carrier [Neoconidiobolus thromboides FSU 785]|nr:mitochondrial carrier [Neoconidiobolus thromboides FSU 785]